MFIRIKNKARDTQILYMDFKFINHTICSEYEMLNDNYSNCWLGGY